MLIRNIKFIDAGAQNIRTKNIYVNNEQRKIFDLGDDLPQISKDAKKIIDANEKWLLMPGMLDSHVHGYGGFDFADVGTQPDGLAVITEALGKTGLSYVMATLVSLELPTLKKALRVIDEYVVKQEQKLNPGSAQIVGVHLEGPFIAKNCRGAHAESALQNHIDLEKFNDIISVAPHIKEWKITLAPDLPGAQEFIMDIKKLENNGIFVKIFIGHTNPQEKEMIDKAITAGAVGFTHLGNACGETCCRLTRQLTTQDAKSHVVQWVLENAEKCPPGVELIVDGVHLSQAFVSLIKNIVGNKIILVTDALGPSGLEDGLYKLGTLSVRKENNSFYLADESGHIIMKQGMLANENPGLVKSLAGSGASLSSCVQQYSEWTGLTQSEDARMQSIYSAAIHNPRITSLSPNAISRLPDDKNFVIFDQAGNLVFSMCNGKLNEHKKKVKDPEEGLLAKQSFLASKSEEEKLEVKHHYKYGV